MKAQILIVDDSLTVRMDLQQIFGSVGFSIVTCETLAEARKALAEQQFALVVLDVLLPDGDGVDLLRELKSAPPTAKTPVILLTTEAEVHDRIRGLKTGADEYAGKPYQAAHIVARARQLVGDIGRHQTTILLIEDSTQSRDQLKARLESAGYRVIIAENGEGGLRSAVAECPDGVIVNETLSGVDGGGVIRRLKDDVTLRNTPCMLLTAHESANHESRTLEAGADAYVHRENIDVILARMQALLRSSGPRRNASNIGLLGPKKILTVDDSPTFLHALTEQLQEEGYDVIPAQSGQEALELLEVQPVDCILLDLMMEGLSGQETCQIVRKNARWQNVPLLILTAVENAKAMVDAINAGADDYVPKSGNLDVLKARLRAQLRRKQFEDEYRAIQEQLLQKEIEAARARAAQEVAEARTAFEPLLRNEEWLNSVVHIAHVGAWDWNVSDDTQTWSDEQFRIFGLAPGSLQPKYETYLQCVHVDDRELVTRTVQRALTKERRYQLDCRITTPSGEIRHVVCQGEICRDEYGKAVRVIGTMLDITERKQAEETLRQYADDLARSNAELQRFAYVASHDLQEPLRMVASYTQLLAQRYQGKLDSDADEFIGFAVEGAKRMQTLIEDLLAYSRIGTRGKKPSLCDSGEIVKRALFRLSMAVAESGAVIEAGNLPAVVCDASQMENLFQNLIGNAIKFRSRSGSCIIQICARQEEGSWVFSVKDNGIGIEPRHFERVFQVFQRLQDRKNYPGNGIGLAICKKVIERHGGRIWLESQPGAGTTFFFTIPCAAHPAQADLAYTGSAGGN